MNSCFNQSNTQIPLSSLTAGDLYEQLLSHLPDCVLVLDENGIVQYANDVADKLLFNGSRSLLGSSFGNPVVEGDITDVELITPNGLRYGEMRSSKLTVGEQILLLVSIRDITETVELQRRSRLMLLSTISTLSKTLEIRDLYTAGHETRVGALAVAIAQNLGFNADYQEGLNVAALLHDLGKIAVPVSILTKPGLLEPEEFALIKIHPRVSFDILKNIDFPWPVAEIALQHHERIDGSGYPKGLTGSDILWEAKIIAVADTVEAMMNDRPYRKGRGKETALEFISSTSGITLDAEVCNACLSVFKNDKFTFETKGML